MKRLSFSFGILTLVFIWIYHTAATDYNPSINPIIGDISYVKKFGHLPAPGTDKNLRIKTHLAYAEMILRNNETLHLDTKTRLRREKLLDHLHNYWVDGEFPINYVHKKEHTLCVTDGEGRICVIGYLVERSAGRQKARNINRESKYSKLSTIRNTESLNDWILRSGLSKEEAAMIEPNYN